MGCETLIQVLKEARIKRTELLMQMYYFISSLKDKGEKLCTIHVIRGTPFLLFNQKWCVTKHMWSVTEFLRRRVASSHQKCPENPSVTVWVKRRESKGTLYILSRSFLVWIYLENLDTRSWRACIFEGWGRPPWELKKPKITFRSQKPLHFIDCRGHLADQSW